MTDQVTVHEDTKDLPAEVTTSTAVATKTWRDEMREKAREAVQVEANAVTGKFISVKGGLLQYDKTPVAGNNLDCIVLASIFENAYYEGEYDPDKPASPVCFAYAEYSEEGMRPHEKSKIPQASSCHDCGKNKFGSAIKGKGKACKNTRRLGLIPADKASLENLMKAEVAYLKLPVTSVKEWAKHVRTCAGLYEMPPFGLVSNLKVVPDAKSQFKLLWEVKSVLPDELQELAYLRQSAIRDELMAPYTEFEDESGDDSTTTESEKVGKSGKKKY